MQYVVDAAHTLVEFSARHMMITNVKGSFSGVSGTVDFDQSNPTAATVDVSIDVNSLSTQNEQRDGHLKSPDFFDVANYPTITFKSTSVEKTGDADYKVTGDLTVHGTTKPVVLDAEFIGEGKDPYGNQKAGFSAKTSISRKDFGLNWNVALESGGVLVSDKINIQLEVQLLQQAPVAAQ